MNVGAGEGLGDGEGEDSFCNWIIRASSIRAFPEQAVRITSTKTRTPIRNKTAPYELLESRMGSKGCGLV